MPKIALKTPAQLPGSSRIKTCSIDGCDKPMHCLGVGGVPLCQNHYKQERRRLRGLSQPGPKPDPSKPRSRYREKTACNNGHPYEDGSFKLDTQGHRVCLVCLEDRRKTHCPAGHEYNEENTFYNNGTSQCKQCRNKRMRDRRPRVVGQGGVNAAKTHCPAGHEYSPENTYVTPDGRRMCRSCYRLRRPALNLARMGLADEQYNKMWEDQDGKCAICLDRFSDGKRTHIDHDHSCCSGPYSCGICVRGLLCKNCNVGLGAFQDSPDLLRAAAEYLVRG